MSDKYQNTELIPEERAAYLLEELSLDEKVAQLNCVFPFDKASYDFAGINEQTKHGIGQVSTLEMRRMEAVRKLLVVLRMSLPLCLIFPEIPEWDGREKRMERIRFLQPAWDQLIQKGARNMRQQDAEQKV